MKVKDLIAQLQAMDPEAAVHIAYDYGDRAHTTVAPEIEVVKDGWVAHSTYHRMPKDVTDDVVDDGPEDSDTQVVILGTASTLA